MLKILTVLLWGKRYFFKNCTLDLKNARLLSDAHNIYDGYNQSKKIKSLQKRYILPHTFING